MHPDIASVLKNGEKKWAAVNGDCGDVMASMPSDSVNLIFGSPPYVDCRDYLENGVNLGIAREVGDWVLWMTGIFDQGLRICPGLTAMVCEGKTQNYCYDSAPFRLISSLADLGFCLRKPPIYYRHGIPGSGGPDWLRNCWEPIVCVTRRGRLPWSDNTACGLAPKYGRSGDFSCRKKDGGRKRWKYTPPDKANPGNVITCCVGAGHMGNDIASENEAPFPISLPEFFIKSFCPPNGIVLDPFCGSGTTIDAAIGLGRRAIGIDLRQSQIDLTKRRMNGVTGCMFTEC